METTTFALERQGLVLGVVVETISESLSTQLQVTGYTRCQADRVCRQVYAPPTPPHCPNIQDLCFVKLHTTQLCQKHYYCETIFALCNLST